MGSDSYQSVLSLRRGIRQSVQGIIEVPLHRLVIVVPICKITFSHDRAYIYMYVQFCCVIWIGKARCISLFVDILFMFYLMRFFVVLCVSDTIIDRFY